MIKELFADHFNLGFLEITLENISHSYKGNDVFSSLSKRFDANSKTVILGNNGSGKSTLLKIISSFITQSKGEVIYKVAGNPIPTDLIPFKICCCSPFLELEENYSLNELFDFHFSLRTLKAGYSKKDFFDLCYLSEAQFKKVKELSSGMTQRLKLAFTFLTESSLILLDEPCMNLDKSGIEMYTSFIHDLGSQTTQIVASNSVLAEYEHCTAQITL